MRDNDRQEADWAGDSSSRGLDRARRKPWGALDESDLEALLAQNTGLAVLVPRALDRLEQAAHESSERYPNGLFLALLRIPSSYWAGHPKERARIERIIGDG